MALSNLALLYVESDCDRALNLAQSAMDAAPDSPDIMDTYGWVLVLGGDADRGVRCYDSPSLGLQAALRFNTTSALGWPESAR